MTTELFCLVLSAILCLALPFVYLPLYQKQVGAAGLAGNRDAVPKPADAAGRGLRAHRNLLENLVPFAIVVIVARLVGVSNSFTVLGAELFLGARIIHAISYFLGIPGLRTLAYLAGVAGMIMIFIQLF